MIGRRGAFLILFGLAYLGLGLSYVYAEPNAPVRHWMAWMPWWSPVWVCGLLFAGAGLISIACAFVPMPADRFGFMALSAVSVGWTIAYLVAWQTGHDPRGWVSALVFLAVGGAVLVVSGMPNPVRRQVIR